MSGAVVFLVIAAVISLVGSLVVYMRNRTPSSLEPGIDDFRREMQAIAPRGSAPRGEDDRGHRSRRS